MLNENFLNVSGPVLRKQVIYQATLDRTPDPAGFQGWVAALETGSSLIDIIPGFVDSAEFQNTYGALSDSDFIALLYNNVLGRNPDEAGLQGWLDAISEGASRADVVFGFAQSGEFVASTSSALTTFMTDINTDWNDTLIGGRGDDILFGGRGADRFVFDVADSGADKVYGLETWDTIQMQGFGYSSEAEFAAFLTQSGSDVIFSDQGVSITFINANIAEVTSLLDTSSQSVPASSKVSENSNQVSNQPVALLEATALRDTNAADALIAMAAPITWLDDMLGFHTAAISQDNEPWEIS